MNAKRTIGELRTTVDLTGIPVIARRVTNTYLTPSRCANRVGDRVGSVR